jgi:hypothetical protein
MLESRFSFSTAGTKHPVGLDIELLVVFDIGIICSIFLVIWDYLLSGDQLIFHGVLRHL